MDLLGAEGAAPRGGHRELKRGGDDRHRCEFRELRGTAGAEIPPGTAAAPCAGHDQRRALVTGDRRQALGDVTNFSASLGRHIGGLRRLRAMGAVRARDAFSARWRRVRTSVSIEW